VGKLSQAGRLSPMGMQDMIGLSLVGMQAEEGSHPSLSAAYTRIHLKQIQ
jgi:hypothetical protein